MVRRPPWARPRRRPQGWGPGFRATPAAPGRFSVVIPVYNGKATLERSVTSVLDQTDQDFEIILVDDGSTDGSLALARRLASDDPRIDVYSIDNSGGPARPRNVAIERSEGEFIAFLDQDDWWLPEKLALQRERFGQGDVALVYSDAVYLDTQSEESGLLISQRPPHVERHGWEGLPEGQVQRAIVMGNFAAQLTVVVRRDWVARVGKLDEEALGVDCYDYLIRVALAGGSFGAVAKPLAVHDRGDRSLSRDQEVACAHTLAFFKDYAGDHRELADAWSFRIGEYEAALRSIYLERTDDPSLGLTERLGAVANLCWLRPTRDDLAHALKALVPPGARRRLGKAAGRPRPAEHSR
jgi:glycosyltransferase involved in cell wall biosynthesis